MPSPWADCTARPYDPNCDPTSFAIGDIDEDGARDLVVVGNTTLEGSHRDGHLDLLVAGAVYADHVAQSLRATARTRLELAAPSSSVPVSEHVVAATVDAPSLVATLVA